MGCALFGVTRYGSAVPAGGSVRVLHDAHHDPAILSIGPRLATLEDAVDDDDILLITWSNGTNSIVEAGWWHQQLPGLEADTEVYGTLGYTRIFPTSTPEGYDHTAQPMYSAQVRAFIDAILEGREPRPNGEDGRVVMRIVEEAYGSAGWNS